MLELTTLANDATMVVEALTRLTKELTLLATSVVAACAAVATVIPKPSSPGKLMTAYKIINALAFNFGKAANKDAP